MVEVLDDSKPGPDEVLAGVKAYRLEIGWAGEELRSLMDRKALGKLVIVP